MSEAGVALERNLRLYAAYYPLTRAYFWAPVFFLYFSGRFPIEQVLQLQSIYYLTVVALELPSGYFSDRVGRVMTLRISAGMQVVAYALFLSGGDHFGWMATAQVAQALSFSFASGTDVSFHYDSLAGLARAAEFGPREARIESRSLLATGASACLGGAIAVLDLRLAYALSLLAAAVNLPIVLAMREPPRDPASHARAFGGQLANCLGLLRQPMLAWLFAFVVLQMTLAHVPYEFAQPYVAAVLGESIRAVRDTPLATGAVTAAVAFIAAAAARGSVRLRDRFGLARVLLGLTALQIWIIALMGSLFHAWVIPWILLRGCYPSIARVLVHAAISPRVPQHQRATFLSLHSLAGRFGYALVLFGLSTAVAGEPNAPETIAGMLQGCAVLAVGGGLALAAFRGALRDSDSPALNRDGTK